MHPVERFFGKILLRSILDLEFVSFDLWFRHLTGTGNIIRVNID